MTLGNQIDLLDAATGTPIMIDTHLATGHHQSPELLSAAVWETQGSALSVTRCP
ncbi:MAG: hypothetical protein IH940_11840 [Acidobacteria bacterium]|nr:hypothetical protein [Acidobacteriota bacterium]